MATWRLDAGWERKERGWGCVKGICGWWEIPEIG